MKPSVKQVLRQAKDAGFTRLRWPSRILQSVESQANKKGDSISASIAAGSLDKCRPASTLAPPLMTSWSASTGTSRVSRRLACPHGHTVGAPSHACGDNPEPVQQRQATCGGLAHGLPAVSEPAVSVSFESPRHAPAACSTLVTHATILSI